MAKHPKPEEIVAKLRQADVLISQGQSVAEAIRAIGVSEVPAGRTPQRRDLLHTSGGTGRDRKLALSRQHHQTARLAGLPTSSSRGVRASLRRLANPVSQVPNGGHSHRALTFKPDHRVGADQHRDPHRSRPLRRRLWLRAGELAATGQGPAPPALGVTRHRRVWSRQGQCGKAR